MREHDRKKYRHVILRGPNLSDLRRGRCWSSQWKYSPLVKSWSVVWSYEIDFLSEGRRLVETDFCPDMPTSLWGLPRVVMSGMPLANTNFKVDRRNCNDCALYPRAFQFKSNESYGCCGMVTRVAAMHARGTLPAASYSVSRSM